jgi:flagellar biosynthesis/type III secretory pathway protein FliH
LTDKGTSVSAPPAVEPLQYALQAFTANVSEIGGAVKTYEENFGEDATADFRANIAEARKRALTQYPAAGWEDGLEATVLAIKANEAALQKQKIELKNEFFEL